MFIRTAAVLLALAAIAAAQAPTPPPPKPTVISLPKKSPTAKPKPTPTPKPKVSPKPKQQSDAIETSDLPPPETGEKTPKLTRPVESSLAAYMRKVKAALAKGWADSLKEKASEFQPGNVSVAFKLDATGKVTEVRITENSSNEAFGKFCEDYVRAIEFAPPPPKSLDDGALEIPFTFWLY